MNSHLCRRVAGGVQGQAVAAVLFQNREEDSCFCTGWILSMQHSSDRSPEEDVGNRERGRRELQESTTTCVSTFCLHHCMWWETTQPFLPLVEGQAGDSAHMTDHQSSFWTGVWQFHPYAGATMTPTCLHWNVKLLISPISPVVLAWWGQSVAGWCHSGWWSLCTRSHPQQCSPGPRRPGPRHSGR